MQLSEAEEAQIQFYSMFDNEEYQEAWRFINQNPNPRVHSEDLLTLLSQIEKHEADRFVEKFF